jgi:hypothetical protein
MSLVPCRECGTLNSSKAEICLSCEYPIKGRQKTNLFRWVALLLAFCLGVPLVIWSIELLSPKPQPEQPGQTTPPSENT